MSEKTPEANRFRFRIWDIEANRFYSDEAAADIGLCLAPTGKIHFWTPDGDRESGLDYIICQSTGLLDKSGKEIFEGDILRASDGQTSSVAWSKNIDIDYYWSKASGLGWAFNEPVRAEPDKVEVIGNVWESGELLK